MTAEQFQRLCREVERAGGKVESIVHDEIVLSAPPDKVEAVRALVHTFMQERGSRPLPTARPFPTPFDVSAALWLPKESL